MNGVSNNNVCIVIPLYNEASVIDDVIKNVKKRYRHVICVDDGSRDGSATLATKAGATVIIHAINLGQGAALQTGIEFALQHHAKYKYFVTFDADGQHDIDDVPHMVEILKQKNKDIVLGSRFLGRVERVGVIKKIVLKLAVKFSNSTTGIKLTDTHNGLRVFTRKAAEAMQLTMPDYAHASEIIERIAEKNLTYTEAPVTIRYSAYSRSKGQSILNAINISFDILLHKVVKK